MAGMEKDLFGESSVEEDSSDDEFPKPHATKEASSVGDKSESGSSSSSTTSSDEEGVKETQDDSVSGDEGDNSDGGDNSVSGDGGNNSDGGDNSVSGDESATPPPANDSQFPSTQDLFGTQSSSDSSDSETEINNRRKDKTTPTIDDDGEATPTIDDDEDEAMPIANEDEQSKITKGIFGEMSSSDDDDDDDDEGASQMESTAPEEGVAIEEEVPRIDVEIPRCLAKLGTDQYFVKLPNFLSIDTRPFDASLYEDEMEEEGELLDEDGRARLKLKVENTIRWRKKINEEGTEEKESNARIVQWTDGSMSLYLGSEIFDIHKQPLQGEFSHLFVRQGTGLQGQAVFKSKLTFRPHSTDSQTHRKMTLSIADRFSKAQKIRVLPVVEMNPESRRSEMIRDEEKRLRHCMKLDSLQRRKKEKEASKELTSSYLQPRGRNYGHDDYEDEEGISISAIKTSVKSRSRHDSFIDDEDDSDGLELDDEQEEEEEEEEMEEEPTKENTRKRQSSQEGVVVKTKGRKLVFDDDDSD